jgi:hypothetical protein
MADYPTIDKPNYMPESDGCVIHGQLILATGEAVCVFTQVEDGALVFQIDSVVNGRHIRINLNDAEVFDGDPEEN